MQFRDLFSFIFKKRLTNAIKSLILYIETMREERKEKEMTKEEATRKIEGMFVTADAETKNFLNFYASGGLHKAIASGRTIEEIFQMAEAKGIIFSDDLKNCMRIIFLGEKNEN